MGSLFFQTIWPCILTALGLLDPVEKRKSLSVLFSACAPLGLAASPLSAELTLLFRSKDRVSLKGAAELVIAIQGPALGAGLISTLGLGYSVVCLESMLLLQAMLVVLTVVSPFKRQDAADQGAAQWFDPRILFNAAPAGFLGVLVLETAGFPLLGDWFTDIPGGLHTPLLSPEDLAAGFSELRTAYRQRFSVCVLLILSVGVSTTQALSMRPLKGAVHRVMVTLLLAGFGLLITLYLQRPKIVSHVRAALRDYPDIAVDVPTDTLSAQSMVRAALLAAGITLVQLIARCLPAPASFE